MRVAAVFALALVSACGASSAGPASDGARCDAILAVSDYASSGVGGFALDGTGALAFGVDLGKDPALATSRGRAFFVDRLGGKVLELEPACGKPTGVVFDTSDPSRAGTTNPQDVAVAADGSLWIPRYDVPSVLVLNGDGSRARVIDLAALDPDGNPNASAIAIAQGAGGVEKAFVTLERLDDTQNIPKPRLASQILRIDVASGAIEAALDLAGHNPFGVGQSDDGGLWLAEPGDFYSTGEAAAGVERFDPSTSTSRIVVGEAALGGSVAEVAVAGGCGAAIVADGSSKNATALVTFDAQSGAALTTADGPVVKTEGYDLEGLLWVGRALVVGDRRATAKGYAVHVLDRGDGCALVERTDVIFVAQKPVAMRGSR